MGHVRLDAKPPNLKARSSSTKNGKTVTLPSFRCTPDLMAALQQLPEDYGMPTTGTVFKKLPQK
ncbi:hypothetical protein FEM03_07490 [Phragmitibacter flavus]|uniref:Uncharacterized protein n=1 Tax=Phragmitibacter flavus TaxID=2576071 RepID=A0A5R8KHA6_9BACT|nr:hypothetical protein [Phragmitibacter flavus]TLD71365.1 hypothetical protein FEM03_07490 [Phragmitibacter flavus]